MVVKIELLRVNNPKYVHYAKATCSKCGRFYDWVKDPANEGGK